MERNGYHQNKYNLGIGRVLGNLADVVNLSERPLYEHARAGRIIGIDYDQGTRTWHFSVRPGFEGPVSDEPQEYLILPGLVKGVFPQLISGLVSSQLYVGHITTTKRKNLVELYGAVSGANCCPILDYY